MAFEKVSTDLGGGDKFKFVNVGDAIEGHYLGDDTITLDGEEVPRYTFQTKTGKTSFLGSFKLNEIMVKVTPGEMVRLTLTEIKPLKGKKTLKLFELQRDPERTISVGAVVAKAGNTTAAAIAAMKAE